MALWLDRFTSSEAPRVDGQRRQGMASPPCDWQSYCLTYHAINGVERARMG